MSAPPPEEVEAFWQHVAALEAEHGVELTDEGKRALAAYIGENGFSPDVTREGMATMVAEVDIDAGLYEPMWSDEPEAESEPAFEEQPWEEPDPSEQFQADVVSDLQKLQTKLGRGLSRSELEGIQEGMERGVRMLGPVGADPETALERYYEDRGEKLPDLSNRHARQARMTERMEDAEQAEKLEREAQEPERVYDPSKHEDRVELIVHRMEGGEVVNAEDAE